MEESDDVNKSVQERNAETPTLTERALTAQEKASALLGGFMGFVQKSKHGERDYTALEKEKEMLMAKLKTKETQVTKLIFAYEKLKKKMESIKSSGNTDLAEEINRLKLENENLKRQFNQSNDNFLNSNSHREDKQEMEKLRNEIEDLKGQIQNFKQSENIEKITNVHEENQTKEKILQNEEILKLNETIAVLQQQTSELNTQNTELKEKYEKVVSEYSDLNKSFENLQQTNQEITRDYNNNIEENKKKYQESLGQLQNDMKNDKKEKDLLKIENAKLAEEIKNYIQQSKINGTNSEKKVSDLEKKLASINKSVDEEKKKYEIELQKKDNLLIGLQRRVESRDAQFNDIIRISQDLKAENKSKTNKITEFENQINALIQKHQDEISSLQSKFEDQIKNYEDQIKDLTSRISYSNEESKGTVDSLKLTIANLEEEKEATVEKLLQDHINELEKINREHEEKMEVVRNQNQTIINNLTKQVKDMELIMSNAQNDMEQRSYEKDKEIDNLNDRIDFISQEKDQIMVELNESEKKKTELKNEIKKLKQQIEEIPLQDSSILSQQIEALRQENIDLSNKLEKSLDRESALLDDATKFEKSITQNNLTRETLATQLTDANMTISSLTNERDVLRKENSRIKEELGEMRDIYNFNQELVVKVNFQEAKITELTKLIESYSKELISAKEENKSLSFENEKVNTAFDAAKKKLLQLMKAVKQLKTAQEKSGIVQLDYIKGSLLQFFEQNTGNQYEMIPIILKLVGANDSEIALASRNWREGQKGFGFRIK